MWSDLFKRWVDMMTWWIPKTDSTSEQREGSPKQAPPGGSQGTSNTSAKTSTDAKASSSGGSTGSSKGSAASNAQQGDAGSGASPATATKPTSGTSEADATTGQTSEGSSKPAQTASPKTAPDDDLAAIKGIGPSIKARLNANGIHSFQDLAGADAEALTTQLKADMVISQKRVQQWIEEARSQAG